MRAADADRALARALTDDAFRRRLQLTPVHVVAVGKAAAEMAAAWCRLALESRSLLVVSTDRRAILPPSAELHEAGHPLPDERSVVAAERALAVARLASSDDMLVILLSGGASALMACPVDGVSLADKQHVVQTMLRAGADIHALNTVRKHLSAIKGGRLAEACRGRTVTLAISDVVGDDLDVIGSGPGVPDRSTWERAWEAFERYVPRGEQPRAVRALLQAGLVGRVRDTPKPTDAVATRIDARVIAGRFDAMDGARAAAEQLGYETVVIDGPVTGEARAVAPFWLEKALRSRQHDRRTCVISSGETTVRVRGTGRGGRNQEFALAVVHDLAALQNAAVASVGTDGIDGPTDAAGAIADGTSMWRAQRLGLTPERHLDDNDSYAFFAALGDLIVTGPTGTNVGDLQVALL